MAHRQISVGKVAKLSVYPVKSTRGHCIKEAFSSFTGMKSGPIVDRNFSVVSKKIDSPDYRTLTAREKPKLMTMVATVKDDRLLLTAPEKSSILVDVPSCDDEKSVVNVDMTFWEEILPAVDCGDAVAQWLSDFLRKKCRLMYHGEVLQRRVCNKYPKPFENTAKDEDEVAFHDAFPFMLATTASVKDLNTRVEQPVTSDNFRPNIVIETSKPYDEDSWQEVKMGEVTFRNVKPSVRCTIITINPDTGTKDPELQPLKTLRSYRLIDPAFGDNPAFGIYLIAENEGIIRVGEEVLVTYMA